MTELYCSSDVMQNLAAQKTYNNLNMTMREAIASRACCVEGVLKCYRHETLETIIDRIAKAEVAHALRRARAVRWTRGGSTLLAFPRRCIVWCWLTGKMW